MDMSDQDAGSEIMVVKDGKSAWERLQDRLQEAPLFQELYRRAREAQNSHLGQQAQKTTDQVKDKIEDAREATKTPTSILVRGQVQGVDDWPPEGILNDVGIVMEELPNQDTLDEMDEELSLISH